MHAGIGPATFPFHIFFCLSLWSSGIPVLAVPCHSGHPSASVCVCVYRTKHRVSVSHKEKVWQLCCVSASPVSTETTEVEQIWWDVENQKPAFVLTAFFLLDQNLPLFFFSFSVTVMLTTMQIKYLKISSLLLCNVWGCITSESGLFWHVRWLCPVCPWSMCAVLVGQWWMAVQFMCLWMLTCLCVYMHSVMFPRALVVCAAR